MGEVAVLDEPKAKKYDQKYWTNEIAHSNKMLRDWKTKGLKIVARYLDDRPQYSERDSTRLFRLNMFHRNVKTQMAMMYSHLPTIDVARTQQDANDDQARVAGDILERLLNLDVQNKAEDYDTVLKSTLEDRLLPGLGCARVRYEVETEEVTNAEVKDSAGFVVAEAYTETKVVMEDAPIDYYYWQDVKWGWCRGWADMPWLSYRNYLTKEEATVRFGEEKAKSLQYKKQKVGQDEGLGRQEDNSNTNKAEVEEIWCKITKKVYWFSVGCADLLDTKEDPLGLRGFYPSPPFFMANPTTTLYKPTPDYHLAQDLYNEVDVLQTRIAIITEAVKVVGVYDASSEEIQRMFKEGFENDMLPVDNYAMFAEKGGVKGVIDWFPTEEVASVLTHLIAVRDQTLALLQNVTGMADVMQGQLQNQYEGVGQSQIKAQASSAVIQTLQEQFATFVSDLMQIKAEVICKHFDPETIITQSNILYSQNAEEAPQAVELLKQPEMANLRIEIRPESIAMIDYAKLKQERTEFLTAFSTFLQSSAPLIEAKPESLPFLLQMLQWTMSGYKGSNEIEGVLDKMVQQAQQQPQEQEEDPEAAKAQGEVQKIEAKAQADMEVRRNDLEADIKTENTRHMNKMAEMKAQFMVDTKLEQTRGQINALLEQIETQGNLEQTQVSGQVDVERKAAETMMEIEKDVVETANQIKVKNEGSDSQ